MSLTFEIENFQELAEHFEKFPGELMDLIPESLSEVEVFVLGLLMGKTPVDTGKTKAAWTSVQTQFGLSFTNTDAAIEYLEHGLYPGVGPKTVATERGIFSTQAPDGIIHPLLQDQAVLNTLAKIFLTSLLNNMRSRGEF